MTVAGGFALSHVSGRTKSPAATVTACGRAVRERSRTMPRVPASADPAICRLGLIGSAGGSAWRLHASDHTTRGPLTVVASGHAARVRIPMHPANAFAKAASPSEGSTAAVGGFAVRENAPVHITVCLETVAASSRALAARNPIRLLASASADLAWRRSPLMTVDGGFVLSLAPVHTMAGAAKVTACGRAARERSRTMPRVPASADPAMCRLGPIGAAGGSAGCPSTCRSLPGAKQTLDSNAPPARPASTPTASLSSESVHRERLASTPTAKQSSENVRRERRASTRSAS